MTSQADSVRGKFGPANITCCFYRSDMRCLSKRKVARIEAAQSNGEIRLL